MGPAINVIEEAAEDLAKTLQIESPAAEYFYGEKLDIDDLIQKAESNNAKEALQQLAQVGGHIYMQARKIKPEYAARRSRWSDINGRTLGLS